MIIEISTKIQLFPRDFGCLCVDGPAINRAVKGGCREITEIFQEKRSNQSGFAVFNPEVQGRFFEGFSRYSSQDSEKNQQMFLKGNNRRLRTEPAEDAQEDKSDSFSRPYDSDTAKPRVAQAYAENH